MGSSSSKPARKLAQQATSTTTSALRSNAAAQTASRPANAPRREPSSSDAPPGADFAARLSEAAQRAGVGRGPTTASPKQAGAAGPGSSFSKDSSIVNDAADPDFLKNLSQLGQVSVPKNKMKFKPSDQTLSILQARARDTEAMEAHSSPSAPTSSVSRSTAPSNRLSANLLVALLDERKASKTTADIARLAAEYDIDETTVRRLAKRFNSVSIRHRTGTEAGKVEDGQEGPRKVDAVWIEPEIREQAKIGE